MAQWVKGLYLSQVRTSVPGPHCAGGVVPGWDCKIQQRERKKEKVWLVPPGALGEVKAGVMLLWALDVYII